MSDFVGYAMIYGFFGACLAVKLIGMWIEEHC